MILRQIIKKNDFERFGKRDAWNATTDREHGEFIMKLLLCNVITTKKYYYVTLYRYIDKISHKEKVRSVYKKYTFYIQVS